MCGGILSPKAPSIPAPPPPVEPAPPPPNETDRSVRDARADQQRRAILSGGRGSNIRNTGVSLATRDADAKKTLLGS